MILAPLLKVGAYSLTVEKAGFQRFVQTGIHVEIVEGDMQLTETLKTGFRASFLPRLN